MNNSLNIFPDNDACTDDTCNPSSGCSNTPKNCDFGDSCQTYSCDSYVQLSWCCHELTLCRTGKGCQNATVPNCVKCAVQCVTNDKCFPKICSTDGTKCINGTAVNCNDNNACTDDSCSNGSMCKVRLYSVVFIINIECINTPKPCTQLNKCDVAVCDKVKGCTHSNKSCDDNNPCTVDSCNANTGACINTLIPGYPAP